MVAARRGGKWGEVVMKGGYGPMVGIGATEVIVTVMVASGVRCE